MSPRIAMVRGGGRRGAAAGAELGSGSLWPAAVAPSCMYSPSRHLDTLPASYSFCAQLIIVFDGVLIAFKVQWTEVTSGREHTIFLSAPSGQETCHYRVFWVVPRLLAWDFQPSSFHELGKAEFGTLRSADIQPPAATSQALVVTA